MKMKIKIQEIAHHRNGVFGAPFYAVRFKYRPEGKDENFLGIVFDEPQHTAVISLDRIEAHGVEFGLNSWRGDDFNHTLRKAIDEYEDKRSMAVADTEPVQPTIAPERDQTPHD